MGRASCGYLSAKNSFNTFKIDAVRVLLLSASEMNLSTSTILNFDIIINKGTAQSAATLNGVCLRLYIIYSQCNTGIYYMLVSHQMYMLIISKYEINWYIYRPTLTPTTSSSKPKSKMYRNNFMIFILVSIYTPT